MKKSDLFRQIGWSQELIEHFAITNDDDSIEADSFDDSTEIFETTTTTISYVASDNGISMNVIVP